MNGGQNNGKNGEVINHLQRLRMMNNNNDDDDDDDDEAQWKRFVSVAGPPQTNKPSPEGRAKAYIDRTLTASPFIC
uniref:Uncharacterized protein n=1 Tax=Globodera rostochiensis TaxID=31243 RepID=A0A914I5X5_GLORO